MNEVAKTAKQPKKKRKTYINIEEFLKNNDVALTNGLLPSVFPYLDKMGYSDALMNQKLAENEGVHGLYVAQQTALGKQYGATNNFILNYGKQVAIKPILSTLHWQDWLLLMTLQQT